MLKLPIGTCRISFPGAGFAMLIRERVMLVVAHVVRIDTQMQLGALAQSINVTAKTLLLQTDTPDVGGTFENRDLAGLPLRFGGGCLWTATNRLITSLTAVQRVRRRDWKEVLEDVLGCPITLGAMQPAWRRRRRRSRVPEWGATPATDPRASRQRR